MTDRTVEDLAKEYGYHIGETGGGCTALEKVFESDFSVLITDGDAAVPTDPDAPVWAGKYDMAGDLVAEKQFPNLQAALDYDFFDTGEDL